MLQELQQLTIIASSFNDSYKYIKTSIYIFTMIPYVISEAHPDYKRPYLSQGFGVVNENEMETYFLDKVSNFVLERIGDKDISLQDINDVFDNYFEDCFMMNEPWSAMVFRNGKWENIRPSNDKILGHIKLILLEKEEIEQEKTQNKKKTQKKKK